MTGDEFETLRDWWMNQAHEAAEATIPKAVEYGSGDLAEIGRAMARMGSLNLGGEQDATELGILFYLIGKVARWEQAVKDGRQASRDTLFDLMVYSMMALRVRDVGGWPWGDVVVYPEHNPLPSEPAPKMALPDLANQVRAAGTARICASLDFGGTRCERLTKHDGRHSGNGVTWS